MAETKRAKLAAALRSAVATMAAGDRLPSEHDIGQDHRVSRETVRAVLRDLANEGLIRVNVGVAGAEVLDRTPLYRDSRPGAAREADQPNSVETRIYVEFADEETAKAFGIEAGDEVFVRDQVVSVGDQRTQLAVSRFPRSITAGTPVEKDDDIGPAGVVSCLAEAGHQVANHVERVQVHRATAEEAAALQVPEATLCLRVVRTTTSTAGTVLAIDTMTLVDRYSLVYDVPAE